MKNNLAIYGGFDGVETDLSQRDWKNNVTILSGDLNGDDVINGSGSTLSITGNGENSYHVIFNNFNGLDNTAVLDGFTVTGGNANGASLYDRGGGMYNFTASSPTLINCTFYGNSARDGGGMANNAPITHAASPTLINCTFSGNKATVSGGAMANFSHSLPVLTNCRFLGNSAVTGGGISNTANGPTLTNCSSGWCV